MLAEDLLIDPRETLDLETEYFIIELTNWLLSTTDDYPIIENISIRSSSFLEIQFYGEKLAKSYPLYAIIFGNIIPSLLLEFESTISENNIFYITDRDLKMIHTDSSVVYEYFNDFGELPIEYLKLIYNFIITKAPIKPIEDIKQYKTIATLVT